MFYDDNLGTENIFFPVCLISEYASVTINVYLYSIHLGILNVTAVFQFPFNTNLGVDGHRMANNCVSQRSRVRPVSGDGHWTNRLQLREQLGALKPEFAFAGSTTRGPVSRPATHSRLEEPVFGRRIDAVSTEINGWVGIEMLVPGIHRRVPYITSRLTTLRRRVPTPYTGRICFSYDLLVIFPDVLWCFLFDDLAYFYCIRSLFSPFFTISRRFVIRARVGDYLLDLCDLLIALATLDALCWIVSGCFTHGVDVVLVVSQIGFSIRVRIRSFLILLVWHLLSVIMFFLSTSTSSLMLLITSLCHFQCCRGWWRLRLWWCLACLLGYSHIYIRDGVIVLVYSYSSTSTFWVLVLEYEGK